MARALPQRHLVKSLNYDQAESDNTQPFTTNEIKTMSDIKTLALYLGCKCRCDRTPTLESIIISVNTNGYAKVHHSNGVSDRFYFSEIKPILRPLESLTNEEAKELINIEYTDNPKFKTLIVYKDSIRYMHSVDKDMCCLFFDQMSPRQSVWMLSKGFDLGLLSEGEYILETNRNV